MTFSLSPGVNSLESELRAIGSKEPILDTLRDASQLVSISGLSSDLHSKMASTYDSGWGGALEAMEQPDCLPRGLPHSGGSSVQMQLWSTNDSAALPAAPSSASLSSVASTNSITNAVTAAAAGVVMDEPCAWTNVHGQATTVPAMRSMTTAATGTTSSGNTNNNTANNNSSATPPTTTTTTTTTNETAQPQQQQQQQQQQPSLQQQQQQPQPFLLSPQDYAGLQPMTTWFMPSPNGAGGFTQCVALPALGNPQNAALLPLPAPTSSSSHSATHVDCGATTNTMPAVYQAVWQPSTTTTAAATNMNIQTAMNNGTQSVQEMPRWVPYMPGQHLVQLPQAFAMATQPAAAATVNNNNNNSNMGGNEVSGQAQVLHHDPSSMFLPMGPGMPYVLLMPTPATTATAPTVQQQQQQQQMQSSWASLPPPPPTLQPASIQTPSSHALPSNASTPQARSSERLTQGNSNTAQPTQNAASNATSYTTQSPSHAVSSLPAVTPPLGPLLYAPAPLMQPHTLIQQQQQQQGGMMMMSGVEKEARATPAYVSPSQQQQQHFLPPPPPPPLPGEETMHALPSQVPPAVSRPITLPTPPWLLPAPTSTSSTTTTVCSTAGMPQTQNAPSTTHAAQTTPHVKAWMGINDQWRPLVYGY